MKNGKFIKSLIFVIIAIVLSMALVGCSCSGNPDPSVTPSTSPSTEPTAPPTDNSTIEVVGTGFLTLGSDGKYSVAAPGLVTMEFGDSYTVPSFRYGDGSQYGLPVTCTITDASGNEVALQYGMLRPSKAGDYNINLTSGSYNKTVVLRCQDTIKPVITIQNYQADGMQGENIPVPYYTASDKAGIDNVRSNVTVVDPDGQPVPVEDGYFNLTKTGIFTVTINVYDNNGNVSTEVLYVRSALVFIDTNVADDHVLMDFDEADYLELAFDVANRNPADRAIVTEGYPAIENEVEGNGVLAISDPTSTPSTVEDVYTRFRMYTGFDFAGVKASALKIRFAVSTDTDYVHLMRDKLYIARFNMIGGLKANVWYEFVIDPLQWGYYMDFTNFIIKFRDKGNTTLYIDEISWVDPLFVDEDLDEDSLGDFNEEGYENIAYQNMYNDPTTTRSYCVDGTTFEYLPEGAYPAANPTDSTMHPGLGAEGGVLKATVGYYFGGMSYMFPELVNVKDISVMSFKMYLEDPLPVSYIFGFFDENGVHLSHTDWFTFEDGRADSPIVGNQWTTFNFVGSKLAAYSTSDYVSGFFIQAMSNQEGGTFDPTDLDRVECVFYIDEITVQKKVSDEETEAVAGTMVTEFATDATMTNVIQPNIRNLGYVPTATLERGDEAFGVTDGVLKITSNYRKYKNFSRAVTNPASLYGDGMIYIFDDYMKASTMSQVVVDYYVPEGHSISSITFAIVCGREGTGIIKVGSVSGAGLKSGQWSTFGYSAEQQRDLIGDQNADGLAIIIKTNADSENNVVYVDSISLYDVDSDETAPTGTFDATDISVVEGTAVDSSFINADIVDDMDPAPTFELVGVIDPNGESLVITDGQFVPAVTGVYTYQVKVRDYAGNYSEIYEVPTTIEVCTEAEYNYLAFGPSAMTVVSDYTDLRTTNTDNEYGEPIQRKKSVNSIVVDPEATDKFALQSTLDLVGGGHVSGVTIDVNDGRNIADVHEITIRLKVVANNGGNWMRIYFNNYSTIKDQGAVFSANSDQYKGGYKEIVIDQDRIQAVIGRGNSFGSNILESISVVSVDNASLIEMMIDSIVITYQGDEATYTFDYDGGVDEDGETSSEQLYVMGELVPWAPTVTKEGSTFIGWGIEGADYTLFDIDNDYVAGNLNLKAIWLDPDWYTFADADAQWVVDHKRVSGAWGDQDASIGAYDWASDGYATGKMLAYGGPEHECHAWVEVVLPDLKVDTISYFSIKLYSTKANSETISITFNEKGSFTHPNWSNSKRYTLTQGVNEIQIPVTGASDEFLSKTNFGETISKMYILGDNANGAVIQLDGIYFIAEGFEASKYTEEFYVETELGDYKLLSDLTSVMLGKPGENAIIRNIDIEGYTFDEDNENNDLDGTILDDDSLVLKRYYTANTVQVTYTDDNGATTVVDHKYNGTVNGPVLNKAGSVLVGWTLEKGSNDIYNDLITREMTLYPVWISNDYSAYNFAGGDSDIILHHMSNDYSGIESNTSSVTADWAGDGYATGTMSVVGKPTDTTHSYIVINLPMLKTTEIERVEITFYSTTSRALYFTFDRHGDFYNNGKDWTYDNAYFTNFGIGKHTVVLDSTYFTEAKFGEYVTSLYLLSHWTTGLVQIDSVGFKAGEVCNLSTYSEEVYLETATDTYVKSNEHSITDKWGNIGSTVNYAGTVIGGYEYVTTADTVASGAVKADGSLVLKSYYKRVANEATFNYAGGTDSNDATFTTVNLLGGDSLSTVTVPSKAGYVFKGWATDEAGTNVVKTHVGASDYYAVWYDLAWLEFNSEDAIAAGTSLLNKNGVSSSEATMKVNGSYNLAYFRIWQSPGHPSYTGASITMPGISMTEVNSIKIRYYITNSDINAKGGAVYLKVNTPLTTNTTDGTITLDAPEFGTYAEKVITATELQAIMGADATLDTLYIQGFNYADNRVFIDYIEIDSTNADVQAYYANAFSTYTVEHYAQATVGGEFSVAKTETYSRIPVGTTVTANVDSTVNGVYDPDNANDKSSGIVKAGETLVLKLYYSLSAKEITYDFNGGVDGDGASTCTVKQYNSDALQTTVLPTKDGYVFMGWSTAQQTDTIEVDADGIVGTDEKFYAVWYDLDWLNFASEADAKRVITKNYTEMVAEGNDSSSAKVHVWQNPTHTDYTYSTIVLPHVAVADLVSIEIVYKSSQYTNNPLQLLTVAFNTKPTADGGADQIRIDSPTTWTKAILTADDIAGVCSDDYLDVLYLSGMNYLNRHVTIDSIKIHSTAPGYPEIDFDVVYDFNGGHDAEGNTSVEVNVITEGTALMDGTGLVREGYSFYGWSTSATVSTFDEMKAAYDLADNGVVAGSVTYYAVWYGDDWLEFNGDVAIKNLIIKGSESAGLNTIATNVDVNNDGTVDGVAGGRAKGAPGYSGHVATQILMPRVAFADIAKFEYSARVYSMAWVDGKAAFSNAYSSGKWFALAMNGAPTSTTIPNNISSCGTDANGCISRSVTNADISAKIAGATEQMTDGGTTNFKVLYVVTTQNGNDGVVFFDYIRITKNA